MQLPIIFTYYFLWHYSRAFRDIFVVWMNYLWFFYHFFSIGVLLKTLFSPWQRLGESYKEKSGGIDLGLILSTLVVNTIMRIIGAAMRLIVIAMGIIVLSVVFLGGILFYVLWVFLPLILAVLLIVGAVNLFM